MSSAVRGRTEPVCRSGSSRATAAPGDELLYTINIRNNGNATVTGAVIRDQIPANVQFLSATANVQHGDFEGSVSGTFSEDQTQLSASGGANGFQAGVTYDNIQVALTTAIPEPGATAACLGGFGLIAALTLRRKRFAGR